MSGRKQQRLSTMVIEYVMNELQNQDVRQKLVGEVLTPLLHHAILKKVRVILYALLLLLSLVLVLLIVQTTQMTLLFLRARTGVTPSWQRFADS